jgi:transcriptional regulator GlxA family with amidase domain
MLERTMPRVVFIAYDGVSLLDLSGPLEAFIAAGFSSPGIAPWPYECAVVSLTGGPVMTADGVELVTHSVRDFARKPIDTIIVPGAFAVEHVIRNAELIEWVRKRSSKCRRVCSVCIGAFFLAAAGLLDGRRAATHWLHCGRLAELFPSVKVEADSIFVRDGKMWTSAGVTSGIDLALALIEEDAGRECAMNIARVLVVYLKRAGGQSQYSALLSAQASAPSDMFSELDRWIAEHLKGDLSVDALARRVNMSPRNFARVYAAQRGRTPAKAVEAIRTDAARRYLEDSTDRIEVIALRCGFHSEEHMRATFVRNLGIPPVEYRMRFTRERAAPRSELPRAKKEKRQRSAHGTSTGKLSSSGRVQFRRTI